MGLAVKLLLAGVAVYALLWLFLRLMRVLLWRVGRRLAFSYLLIGVLPIPMLIALALLNGYLLAGYFLGHLHRDAVDEMRHDLGTAAEMLLAGSDEATSSMPIERGEVVFARYRGGRRVAGDGRLPDAWPDWLTPGGGGDRGRWGRKGSAPFLPLAEELPTLAAVAGDGDRGVVAAYDGRIASELARRSGVWVDLITSDDPRRQKAQLQIFGRVFDVGMTTDLASSEDRERFFAGAGESAGFLDRPSIRWPETSDLARPTADGPPTFDKLEAHLEGSPRLVGRGLLSGSVQADARVWAALISVTGLLGSLYGLAVMMALWIIYTLSRAVNRLSRATRRVQQGDFSVRIPVRRTDQVGDLQRSFNMMASNLETLVASAAQKEILDKELEIARELQESLLPAELPSSDRLDFATLFEPSAAIGGDYFDVLTIDEDRLAVVIADVSGHGLPTGLRMAMLKAALVILVEESKEPEEILRRLSDMIRSGREKRFFITATIATVDLARGRLELTNAGHSPTYRVRDGAAREILLPGNPLGALGNRYGHSALDLEPGDIVVWLSDGLIEATDPRGEPFGYERIRETLAGRWETAAEVRNHLLAVIEKHTRGREAEDDQTLVAMRYLKGPES
jgi:HAMP domain-containing protein